MTTLFDATQTRKSNRNFGRGILRSLPTTTLPCTLDDMAWAAQAFGELSDERDNALDRHFEERAIEAYATDCLCRGVMPSDVAEMIASTRVGGHMA